MEYKKVKIVHGSVDVKGNFFCNDLNIDGTDAEYDINVIRNTTTFKMGYSGHSLVLKRALMLNEKNPKETLDRFFKLLLLQ